MKNILVTGGTRGIGRAITDKLLADGHRVYVVYKESTNYADELIKKHDNKVVVLQVDLSKRQQINQLILQLKDVQFDGIVNNAGIVYLTKWDELNFDEWDETIAVNLTAPLKLVHGLRDNLKNGASIVNIASTDGYYAAFDTIAYAASKAALMNITKSLAAVLGPRGIRVNAVAPGWVETEMTDDTMPDESKELAPLKRNAMPEEIANIVNFLLSDSASFISGTTITADGGLTTIDYTLYKESGR